MILVRKRRKLLRSRIAALLIESLDLVHEAAEDGLQPCLDLVDGGKIDTGLGQRALDVVQLLLDGEPGNVPLAQEGDARCSR